MLSKNLCCSESYLYRRMALKQSLWTTFAIAVLDTALLVYVNMSNNFKGGEFFLAIPCAFVGVIIFWVHVIRNGNGGGGMNDPHGHYCKDHKDYLSVKKKASGQNESIFGLQWFLSFFLKQKEQTMIATPCQNPIIKKCAWNGRNEDAGKR